MNVLSRLYGATMLWVLSLTFLLVWWWPLAIYDGSWVHGLGLMVMEFLVIHSSGLCLGRPKEKRFGPLQIDSGA